MAWHSRPSHAAIHWIDSQTHGLPGGRGVQRTVAQTTSRSRKHTVDVELRLISLCTHGNRTAADLERRRDEKLSTRAQEVSPPPPRPWYYAVMLQEPSRTLTSGHPPLIDQDARRVLDLERAKPSNCGPCRRSNCLIVIEATGSMHHA